MEKTDVFVRSSSMRGAANGGAKKRGGGGGKGESFTKFDLQCSFFFSHVASAYSTGVKISRADAPSHPHTSYAQYKCTLGYHDRKRSFRYCLIACRSANLQPRLHLQKRFFFGEVGIFCLENRGNKCLASVEKSLQQQHARRHFGNFSSVFFLSIFLSFLLLTTTATSRSQQSHRRTLFNFRPLASFSHRKKNLFSHV